MKKVKILIAKTFTKIYKCEWKLGNKRAGDQDYETLIEMKLKIHILLIK